MPFEGFLASGVEGNSAADAEGVTGVRLSLRVTLTVGVAENEALAGNEASTENEASAGKVGFFEEDKLRVVVESKESFAFVVSSGFPW